MAAPDAALLAGMRAGTLARHLFFRMTHPAGDVYAWDGIGEMVLAGHTYQGIGSAAAIEGVSTSADLQNSVIEVTLNGVPFSAVRAAGTVRGETAVLTAGWINEAGAVIASRVLFSGKAGYLRSKINGDTVTLSLRVRAALADWGKAPASFYSIRDQTRLYASDTGFDFVKEIESGTSAGWSETEEVTTYRAVYSSAGICREESSGFMVGSALYGPNIIVSGTTVAMGLFGISTTAVTEETSGAAVSVPASGTKYIRVGGVDCYIAVSGDLRTPGGVLVLGNALTAEKVRRQGTISAIGTASATYLAQQTINGTNFFTKLGTAYVGTRDCAGFVYDNKNPTIFLRNTAGAENPSCFENGTGTAVTISGGGRLQVGGADCTVSSTGAIRSPLGNFIVPTGLLYADGHFMRVWT